MEGAGILTLIGLLVALPFGLVKSYNEHFATLGPREAALQEAAHGAALIVLAVLTYLRMGRMLPGWFALAALAVAIWGILRLHHGAKFSVGWRDPKLIAASLVKTGLGLALYVLVWNPPAAWRGVSGAIDAFLYATAPFGAWAASAVVIWCLVTGLTKLVLVLRGFPATAWETENPGMPHGNAPFANPSDAAQGLKK